MLLIPAFFSWWYGLGWLTLGRKVGGRVNGVLSFFSVGQLALSLFAPFRQISAGKVRGPLGVQLRAFVDRLFSRGIGAVVRLLLIFAGLIMAAVYGVFGLILLVMWPFLPALPVIGLIVTFSGFAI